MDLLLSFFLSLLLLAPADAEKEKAAPGTFALTNCRIETITNGTIESGTLVIENGRIAALGASVAAPAGAQTVDCAGGTVYPGMIDSGTQLGLVEIGSLSETRDFAEIGEITPHMRALTAVNPNGVAIPVTRVNGVTTVLSEPTGGLLPGTAALVNLFGYTPEQMQVGGAEAVILDYPSTGRRGWWDDRDEDAIEKQAKKALDKLDEVWDQATLYARIDSAYAADPEEGRRPEFVPAMQALVPVVRGEMPLILKASAAPDIRSALEWVEKRGLTENVIFSGVEEGWRVADKLAEAGIPCLVGPVLSVPSRASDRFDKAYANPGLLAEAGVEIALRTGESENVRNLPYHAGFAVAYGLSKEEALRAVTLGPARIFGVADEMGSLEVGKQATLFVADGDPFETATDITHVFIEGYAVPLESRHTELYDEFLERIPGLVEQPSTDDAAADEPASGMEER